MNANGKECLLNFAKLLECDTSSCRFASNAAPGEKAVRGRPALRKHFMRNVSSFVLISVIRGQQ
jgi:hypothetical protein